MPLLALIVLALAAIALIKLGALSVWVSSLAFALKLSIAVALILGVWFGWKYFTKP